MPRRLGITALVLAAVVLAPVCIGADTGGIPAPAWWPWPERHRDIIHTWLDAFNFLDLVPGPPFLLVFIVYVAVTILGCRLLERWILGHVEAAAVNMLSPRLPFDLKPNYAELAYLRGGKQALVEAVLCNLYRLRLLDTDLTPKPASQPTARPNLSSVEYAALKACSISPPYNLLRDPSMLAAVNTFVTKARHKFGAIGLLPSLSSRLVWLGSCALGLLLIEGLGGVRLARALMRGYTNVELLIALMVIAVLVIPLALYRRLSRAGDRYIAGLKQSYKPVLRKVQAKVTTPDSAEALYAAAVFGAGALSATSYGLIVKAMMPPAGSCDGGGCGGGGCGGGGCGGGGCGGG